MVKSYISSFIYLFILMYPTLIFTRVTLAYISVLYIRVQNRSFFHGFPIILRLKRFSLFSLEYTYPKV